nr:hypothetical protein [Ruegeria atlantica]
MQEAKHGVDAPSVGPNTVWGRGIDGRAHQVEFIEHQQTNVLKQVWCESQKSKALFRRHDRNIGKPFHRFVQGKLVKALGYC